MDLQQLTIHPFPTASMHETCCWKRKDVSLKLEKIRLSSSNTYKRMVWLKIALGVMWRNTAESPK